MSSPLPCPDCGAGCMPDEAFCWMCHRKLWGKEAPAPAAAPSAPPSEPPVSSPPAPPAGSSDNKAAGATISTTMALTLAAAWFIFPPLAILLSLTMLPAMSSFAFKTTPASNEDTWVSRAGRMLLRILVGLAILIQVLTVVAIALFVVCVFFFIKNWK